MHDWEDVEAFCVVQELLQNERKLSKLFLFV